MKDDNKKWVALAVLVIAIFMFKGEKMADESEIPLVLKQTYEFGSHTIKLNSLDFIGSCECHDAYTYSGCVDGCCRSTSNPLRTGFTPLVNFRIDGEDYFYEGGNIGSPTTQSRCYAFPPASDYLDTWVDLRNEDDVLFNIDNYNIIMKKPVHWGVAGTPGTTARQYCDSVYGGGAWSSSLNSCDADYPIGLELVKTDYAISTDAPVTLYLDTDYDMPITVDGFDTVDGFLEVIYSYPGSIFDDKLIIYNYTWVEGQNNVTFKLPTQTEGLLSMSIKAGIYINMDKERIYTFTNTMQHSISIDESGQNTAADTNHDGCVSDTEFPAAAYNWKQQQGGITDLLFPIVVNKWKTQEGCQ